VENVIEFKQVSQRINWHTIFFVGVFHLFAVWALFTFSWQNLAAALVLWWIAASWGVGIGYHRLMTHRGFKAPKWLEYFMSICGTLALQSGPLSWVTTHRIHHAFTETDKDPHSPRNGTYWAHIGWIFKGTAQHQSEAAMNRYTPDMAKDKFHIALNKYYYLTIIAAGAALFAIGGWSMVLWAVFLRITVSWHFTWLVNSATHLWGSRRFDTRDDSRNNGLVAAVTFGEGWHNNHHAHPRSARHGLTWREFDVNWIQLRMLEKLGIISELYGYELEKSNEEARQLQQAA
jgi:stearoyl-CoA desaturase (delta-9 desaturase)